MMLTADERDWLRRIEDKIDRMILNGCAKASLHAEHDADHEARLRMMEREASEGRGREMVKHGLLATGISIACVFIGRLFK
jgi:hypothetical protein